MNDWKNQGTIQIADEVVAVIARIATLDTNGIYAMSGGIAEGIAKRVSGKSSQKGIEVSIEDNQTSIDLKVIVHYGTKIDRVCHEAQRNVKEMVENMTGIEVKEVNVRVESVDFTHAQVANPELQQPNYLM